MPRNTDIKRMCECGKPADRPEGGGGWGCNDCHRKTEMARKELMLHAGTRRGTNPAPPEPDTDSDAQDVLAWVKHLRSLERRGKLKGAR